MFKLLGFEFEGSKFEVLISSWTGLECLLIDGEEVVRQRSFRFRNSFRFVFKEHGELSLSFDLLRNRTGIDYVLRRGDQVLLAASAPMGLPKFLQWANPRKPTDQETAEQTDAGAAEKPSSGAGSHLVPWLVLASKIFQSGKAVKVALAGMAVSGWTILYSLPFALSLVAVLVIHEWGHLRAMQRFGIPTKGMYLIPFVGGIAVGDSPKTHWQDVYISLMGPVYGLGMTVVCYLAYLMTANHMVGLLASMSALVNVFNLLPILPLDGGRVVKALVFSGRSRLAFMAFLAASAVCFAVSVMSGLALLSFFVILGAIDLLFGWRDIQQDEKIPLDRYGIVFCGVWYLLTIIAFVGIIMLVAASELPGSELAVTVLQS